MADIISEFEGLDGFDDEDRHTSTEDAIAVGFKVIEMANRAKAMTQIVPGAKATWGFDIDDTHFTVTLSVDTPEAKS